MHKIVIQSSDQKLQQAALKNLANARSWALPYSLLDTGNPSEHSFYESLAGVSTIVQVIQLENLSKDLMTTMQLMHTGRKLLLVIHALEPTNKEAKILQAELGIKTICLNLYEQAIPEIVANKVSYTLPKPWEQAVKALKNHQLTKLDCLGLMLGRYQSDVLQPMNQSPSADMLLDELFTKVVKLVNSTRKTNKYLQYLDDVLTHKYLGTLIFFGVIYVVLGITVNLGGIIQEFCDGVISMFYINNLSVLVQYYQLPSLLSSVLVTGFGQGINTVLSFLPIISIMFFLISCLEASGYIARANKAIEQVLQKIGLPGETFVPLIIGFGCNVPSILAMKDISNYQSKVVATLMSPFLSCSARLTVYSVFVGIFFNSGGQNVIFSLYLLGILVAILTGYLLRGKLPNQANSMPVVLPNYAKPNYLQITRSTLARVSRFVANTGKYIVLACIIISILNDVSLASVFGFEDSLMVLVGKIITPMLEPMGLAAENWQVSVSLITGAITKEVILATLHTLYSSDLNAVNTLYGMPDLVKLMSIALQKLYALPGSLLSLTNAELDVGLTATTKAALEHALGDTKQIVALLIFIALYSPCVSTAIVIGQQLNRKWMIFSIAWSFVLGYVAATIFYQAVTIELHPWQSLSYIIVSLLVLGICWLIITKKIAPSLVGE